MPSAEYGRADRSRRGPGLPGAQRGRRARQSLELEESDLGGLYEQPTRAGSRCEDCARESAPAAPVDDAALAHVTTDTLQLFLNEIAATGC